MIKYLLLNVLVLSSINLLGQVEATNSDGQVKTVQPKIMVVPKILDGQDYRTILNNDVNKRTTCTKIKEAFDKRGFTTVDFLAKLKTAEASAIITSNDKNDLKSDLIRYSGADIFVEFEVIYRPGKKGNMVRLSLTAYETSTGNSLANKIGDSPINYTTDFGALAHKAVEGIADDFLNVLQTKFSAIVENGRSINIIFSFDKNSDLTMESEVGADGYLLADLIEIWMEENAYKNNYNIQTSVELLLIFDDVKIPLKNQETGRNYNPNKFAREIWDFLRNDGVQTSRTVSQSKILITIK